jgi:eukaryotic-like serine/threonine-protein kinase
MTAALSKVSAMNLDDFVEAYEAAQRRDGDAPLEQFLTPPDHPLYPEVLRELVRVDLEFGWERGAPRPLAEYVRRFPLLGQDRTALEAVAFEEYRLRWQAGQTPTPAEYQRTYGVNVLSWGKEGLPPPTGSAADDPLRDAALAYKSFLLSQEDPEAADVEAWCRARAGGADHACLFRDLHRSDPAAAGQLARAATSFPEPGGDFLGFHLLGELGRGAFGRVYLASQPALANRLVALKVAVGLGGEAQTLARLQHTNICPVYSIHHADTFQALCMPFLGSVTLAQVLRELRGRNALPDSGKGLVGTLPVAQSRTRLPTASSRSPLDGTAPPNGERQEPAPEPAPATLEMLGRLSYVEAVLWLGACLADGLAHAHEHGILHRDLKPANVLLTDSGQPLLLDFNLAADAAVRETAAGAVIGGTLPYMAPEHLEAFHDGVRPVDQRSDIYSLGVILHELLTLHYPVAGGAQERDLSALIERRSRRFASVRCDNPAVSPATEAILRRCLAPDPAQRYQSARELRQDLQCQLEQRPLRHTPEPSLRERFRKWRRRHPRLTSASSVLLAAGLVILLLLTALGFHQDRLASLEAQQNWVQTGEEWKTVEFLLESRNLPRAEREAGEELGRKILDRYGVLDDAAWRERPALRRLTPAQRRQLTLDLGDLLQLQARAVLREAADRPAAPERDEQLRFADRLNLLAETCYEPEQAPRSLWAQRAALARAQGRQEEAGKAEAQAAATPLRSARDRYLLATAEADQGRYQAALPLLREAVRQEPPFFCAWFALGFCHDRLAQHAEAVHCYSTAIVLWPRAHWLLYFDRGLSYLKQQEFALAAADFDEAVGLRPEAPEPYINRALARQGLRQFAEAGDDLTHALELGAPYTRVYFMRAWVRERAGDAEGARRDREAGLKGEPRDEESWVARAVARLGRDPDGALADLDKALEVNPRSLSALQTKAHVLANAPGRARDCLRVLERTVDLYPDFVSARSGRGVLRARLGQGEAALADAEESLRLDGKPATLYQVAGIYARLSGERPEHRVKALQLLSAALREGFGFDLLERDQELDSIRELPEFRRLVEAARALRPASGQKP